MEVLGVPREAARQALSDARWSVRTAIVMLHSDLDLVEAEARLDEVDRRLREIVGSPPAVETES